MASLRGHWGPAGTGLQEGKSRSQLQTASLVLLTALFLIISTLVVAADALLTPGVTLNLSAGQVATSDIRAPTGVTYESEVLTRQRRDVAANSVPAVYDPPDPGIARQQIGLARQILDYIRDVRADEYASQEMLIEDIKAISGLSLPQDVIITILNSSPERWQNIDQQIIAVLERVMRTEIRDDTLRSIKANIPNMVSIMFREDEVVLISAIVEDLIQTNTFYNEERTQQARQAAADAVLPEVRSFNRGQFVIRDGSVVTEADMEALAQLGLLEPEDTRMQHFVSALALNMILMALFGMYTWQFYPTVFRDIPLMLLLGGIFLVILIGARLVGQTQTAQAYLYSTAVLGLLFATLAGPQIAVIGTIILAGLVGVMGGGVFSLSMMALVGGIMGILTLKNTERLNSYFMSGILIGLVNAGMIVVLYLGGLIPPALNLLVVLGAGFLNGVLAGVIALAVLYLISNVFNIPTSLRLIELTQPNQELMQRLLREAPGTYQHSLQVANLAELAAERIGANAMLTRVGALYHDVGKMAAPHFFVENQVDGINPHDSLNDPIKRARIIIGHVIEGEKMARRYRLPARIRDFILEHHGTTMPMYFYNRAVQIAGGDEDAVDRTVFTYPGPRPRTRETAILMLADSCESTVRARRPQNTQQIVDTVKYVFDTRMREEQLSDSGLTLRDVSIIQRVFVESLQGVFHARISYLKDLYADGKTRPEAASAATREGAANIPAAATPGGISPVAITTGALEAETGHPDTPPGPERTGELLS